MKAGDLLKEGIDRYDEHMADEDKPVPEQPTDGDAEAPALEESPVSGAPLIAVASEESGKTGRFQRVKQLFSWRRKKRESEKIMNSSPETLDYETLVEAVTRQSHDAYWTLRIPKRLVIILLGLGILLMWLWYLVNSAIPDELLVRFIPNYQQTGEEMVAELSPDASAEIELSVRVRSSAGASASAELVERLKTHGLTLVEVVEEESNAYEGVSVISKRDDLQSREIIGGILANYYTLSSPSAELTDDSDFDVVVLLGGSERLQE